MPCFHPLKAFRDSSGVKVLPGDASIFNLQLPCGQCVGCRLEYSRQWAMRCLDESKMHKENSFITLTYDQKHLPVDNSLDKRAFQLFMKRLRKRLDKRVRFYHAGEYGEKNGRPHYHAILFNFDFPDKKLHTIRNGYPVWISKSLDEIWGLGICEIGTVTYESAAYVARYIVDKLS